MTIAQTIIQRLRTILIDKNKIYPLHEPQFSKAESQYVQNCLSTGWVSSIGSYVNQFESQLAELTGASYVIATVNGTAALHTCYMLSGIEPGDEVLLPALTFVATANAASYCRAIPHFVDSDLLTLGVDAKKLSAYLDQMTIVKNGVCYNSKTGRRIRALCVSHVFGHPADLQEISSVCKRFHIILIEDAAEALGSYYHNQHVGNFSLLSALSFNGNKIITTGGGGAILTNKKSLAEKAKHLTTTSRLKHQWQFIHNQVGYNYRMPNINAALGCAQLEKIKIYLNKKRALTKKYKEAFSDLPGVKIFSESVNTKSNYWLNALIIEQLNTQQKNQLLSDLNANNIQSRPIWELMHRLPMYAKCPRMDLSNSESLFLKTILLPSSPGIIN